MRRGYFDIGIYCAKIPANLGTLWQSASQLGAAGIFIIGRRFKRQSSDVTKAYKHIPLREFENFDHFQNTRPYSCPLIGIEIEGEEKLSNYKHTERAIYLLGAEDNGLPSYILEACNRTISLESINDPSYNVSIAGTLIMYHRQFGFGGSK